MRRLDVPSLTWAGGGEEVGGHQHQQARVVVLAMARPDYHVLGPPPGPGPGLS